jgi:eukaryotic-like serine/threonine-protein kinase
MPNIPASIGRYAIIEPFGPQCMGPRYRATDTVSGDPVLIALRMEISEVDHAAQERFLRQVSMEVEIQHPNIAAVRDFGQYNGTHYTVMDYLDCESLDHIVASRRQVPLTSKLGYIVEVCHALSFIHGKKIVHRNVKAANVLVLKTGSVKLFDFNCACMADGDQQPHSAREQVAGTLTHMSPEQIMGHSVDARSDLFSTGVVLYQLLTGSLPFEGRRTAETLMTILNDPPAALPSSLGKHSARLQEINFRALAKDRNLRYQSAESLAHDLGEVCQHLSKTGRGFFSTISAKTLGSLRFRV